MVITDDMISAAKKDAEKETEFKKEIFMVSLLKRALTEEKIISEISHDQIVSHGVKKKQSMKEFLLPKKLISDVDKVLFMGYFLEKHETLQSFNIGDIKDAYVKSKESLPDNINDKINVNIKKGLITEYPEKKDNKKAYHLTATGEQVVENWSHE